MRGRPEEQYQEPEEQHQERFWRRGLDGIGLDLATKEFLAIEPEEQYQERFWRRGLDGIGLDLATKEFLAIEFKRTQDARSNYVERATAVAQEQYKSLLTGLQAVDQVKGWKVQQIVFVGGTCRSIRVESFNRNMKALGVLESKWDPIRKKLVRRLLEEQGKVLTSYFAQKGGARSKGWGGSNYEGREHVQWDVYA
jgi:hypothetical protein